MVTLPIKVMVNEHKLENGYFRFLDHANIVIGTKIVLLDTVTELRTIRYFWMADF